MFCNFLPSGSSWDELEGRLALSQAESDGQSADWKLTGAARGERGGEGGKGEGG